MLGPIVVAFSLWSFAPDAPVGSSDGDELELDLRPWTEREQDEQETEEVYVQSVRADPASHQVLGHVHSIQDDAVVEALLERDGLSLPVADQKWAALEQEAMDWVSILQLRSDPALGWRFANDGELFVVGPREAVAAGHLQRVRVIIQR